MRKFLRLPASDRRLLVESGLLLGMIRLGLWLLPFSTLRHLLARISRTVIKMDKLDHKAVRRISWAVVQASRYIPKAETCLTHALATQILLARRGYAACFRIGVAREEKGRLQAHAWVESEGRIVIGDLEDLSRYTPLSSLDENGR